MGYADQFGFLPVSHDLSGSGFTIRPVEDLNQILEYAKGWFNPDGFIYPPSFHLISETLGVEGEQRVPNSERPALLHPLPPTHDLFIAGDKLTPEAARHGPAGLVIHFAAHLFGFRAQFHDWWFDGRVPYKPELDHHPPRPDQAGRLIGAALEAWRSFPPRQQRVAINALFLACRTTVYEFEWERFQAEYQVADALFALARDLGRLPSKARPSHAARLRVLCESFGIPVSEPELKQIVDLRNDLIHEALWDGGMPGTAAGYAAFRATRMLRGISNRVLLALLGCTGRYVQSEWWGWAVLFFEAEPA